MSSRWPKQQRVYLSYGRVNSEQPSHCKESITSLFLTVIVFNMNSSRAPKQWSLTKNESITSFEAWRQNLQYSLSLDANFAPFLADTFTWQKKSSTAPNRGLTSDGEAVPEARRRTAAQKNVHLELMLGQIANFCPVISRNTIVKNTTSVKSIWQAIRSHFGFQSTGAHFLDFSNIKLEVDERPEDLFQRLMSFTEDNLLVTNGNITHHGEVVTVDEELSPTLENFVVLTWLRLIHADLPALVKQRYGTELRSRTLASLKPEISQALDSLLDEIRSSADTKILRATASRFRQPPPRSSYKSSSQALPPNRRPKSCPLCKQAGRNDQHFLSACSYLPPEDRTYLSRSRLTSTFDDEESDYEPPLFPDEDDPPLRTAARTVSRRVSTKQSPHFKAFYKHHPLRLTLDTGAETSMIKSSVARSIGATIVKSSQQALQADGMTPLAVAGETHLILSRADKQLGLDALVVDDLDVDVLAGTPFLIANDITVRPALCQVRIQDSDVIHYNPDSDSTGSHAIRRAQSYVLRASSSATVVWPGEYVELDVPSDLGDDCVLALQPRTDTPISKHTKPTCIWPEPQVIEAVGSKIRLTNSSNEPKAISRHEHLSEILPTVVAPSPSPNPAATSPSLPVKPHSRPPFSSSVSLDPDKLLPDATRLKFQQLLQKYDGVFNPDITGYNGAAGPIKATVNMGPVQPPQRKGRVPQYSRNNLVQLQAKFDELEQAQVFRRPEDLGITVEYLNPSFLVKKPSGGHRLVTAFADVARYSKPQPSLMPDVDTTLRTIAPWRYMIQTDLTRAFYQIPLAQSSLKYCGVATPFRGIRVYTRSAMGMPGSETALEELMCRVLGDLIQEGCVAKLADDLYCGGDSPETLLSNWSRVLEALDRCNLRLSPMKTVICPKTTTILGWIWSQGKLSASPHRIAVLQSCPSPQSVKGLRSFIGAYKVLSRVLPNCSDIVDPLESSLTGLQSSDKLLWDENLTFRFKSAQEYLSKHKSIVLPRPSDILWIVTDGSVTKRGLGATLYVTRDSRLYLAGFYSAKLRKHQVTWLPCEVEALSIAAAVKHFSPFIIQSQQPTTVLTDSKPCVQAIEKLCRGEFSASPRVTSFLTTVSRYQVSLQHLAGKANLPSDFTSRNAPDCSEPTCQICTFVHEMEDSVVRSVSLQDILDKKSNLPFTTRSAWLQIQNDCPDLRRVHAHLKQGTRPSKKITNIRDVKRYLSCTSIARDGVLIVKHSKPFVPASEAIIVPRSVLDGLLTALHIKLNHPSRHQLQMVFQRQFFALDMTDAISRVTSACHTCASLKSFPSTLVSQSSDDPPVVIGISFAADVIKRHRQFILILRECSTSLTASCLIPDEKHDTLRDALTKLIVGLHPLDGPRAVIRVDLAPGFSSLSNNDSLGHLIVSIDVGRIKNKNHNPVAEKAVRELEEELLRQQPGGGPVGEVGLALATARLNSRLRFSGLSSLELWTQRNQFTHEQLPLSDYQLILDRHEHRSTNHAYSEKSKNPRGLIANTPPLQVGDIVYLFSDKDKSRARDRYVVVSIDTPWCFVKKFRGSQLRATSYKVKLSECYSVPSSVIVSSPPSHPPLPDMNDEPPVTPAVFPAPVHPMLAPPAPPELITIPSDEEQVPSFTSDDPPLNTTSSSPAPVAEQDESSASVTATDQPMLSPPNFPALPDSRPQRQRRPPSYLQDYVRF